MRKEYKVWTLISSTCHDTLFRISEEKKAPATKIIMNIIYNKLPIELKDDYTFTTEGAKKIVITLNIKEYEHITELAKSENVKTSKYLRMLIYSYFKREGYIE